MSKEEQIILVNKDDVRIGAMGKLETHEKGLLHRAFSIFVKNNKGEIMLQKRARGKYHSGGLWSNTCCGHPRDGADLISAAHRRLTEEMGFDCPLKEIFTFMYQANLDSGLKENEFLHVFIGEYNNAPVVNPEEVSDWKWMKFDEIKSDVSKNPDDYTYWFKIMIGKQELSSMLYRLI
ncbi:MAG: isopentenyl-diphosphate Delta-isomerase [bacterium]|nr:isopentenyl-diphosphate Delta-isomerase [bacterium]